MSCYVQDQIQDALDELGKATAYENITVAICGQPKMVEDVMARVCNAGIQRKNVIVEKY
jgi:NAD(P)H-flavin reductase